MVLSVRALLPLCLVVGGCHNGLDLSGDSMEGYESFGGEGGSMETPDGNIEVEVDPGVLGGELELSVGQLDDCFPGAIACYEIEPAGLRVAGGVTVTLDIAGLVGAASAEARAPLSIYVDEGGSWRRAQGLSADRVSVSLALRRLGRVALVPG